MTIKNLDGFDYGSSRGGNNGVSTGSSVAGAGRRGGYAFVFDNLAPAHHPNSRPSYSISKDGGANSYVMGMALKLGSGGVWCARGMSLVLWCVDSDADPYLCLVTGTDGDLEIWRHFGGGTGTATLLETASGALADPDTYYFVEFAATFSTTVGAYELRINGSTVASDTNVNTGTDSEITTIRLHPSIQDEDTEPLFIYIDDFYVVNVDGSWNNDFLGDHMIDIIYPTANGNHQDFTVVEPNTAAHWEVIDEVEPDGDTSYIATTTPTAGERESFVAQNIPSQSEVAAVAVCVNHRTEPTVSPLISAGALYRENGTSSGPWSSASGGFNWVDSPATYDVANFDRPYFTATSGTQRQWSASVVNNMEIGAEITTSSSTNNKRITQIFAQIMYRIPNPSGFADAHGQVIG